VFLLKSIKLEEFCKIVGGVIEVNNFEGEIELVGDRVRFLGKNSAYFNIFNSKLERSDFENSNTVIISEKSLDEELVDFTHLRVKNIDEALIRFVRYYRNLFDIPVVGITGTCGKTTTKEMIKFILSKSYQVEGTISSKNAGYFNLPYLTSIDDSTDVAVFEMGVAEPNDILESNIYFGANIGLITNIGYDHFNGCGDLEGYVKAKSEMKDIIEESGYLILNSDCKNTARIDMSLYKGNLLYFGKEGNDFIISDANPFTMTFTLSYNKKKYKVKVPGLGEHNMYNATAAIIVCHLLGIGINQSIEIIKDYNYIKKHLEVKRGRNGSIIIDDSFSSNPTSLEAAIKVLMNYPRKKIVVLSKMGYLDSLEKELHLKMGGYLSNVDHLITLDDVSKLFAVGAIENGLAEDKVHMIENIEELEELLLDILDENTVVLFKTSMLDNHS